MGVTRAVLIGNWKYEDPDEKLQPLRSPEHDLRTLREALIHPEFGLCRAIDVTVQPNLRWSDIGRVLMKGVRSAEDTDDALIIYYSGHGEVTASDTLGLCGVDTRYSEKDSESFNAHELGEWIKNVGRARSTVVILDCCYSGVGLKSGGVVTEDRLARSFGQGVPVLSSGGDVPVPDGPQGGPSPFTGALAAAMINPDLAGDHGDVTVTDVYNALLRTVRPQPMLNGPVRGAIRLARRPIDQSDLVGWTDQQTVEVVDLTIGADPADGVPADQVTVSWEDEGRERTETFPLGLDANTCAAVRRLTQLADGVVQHPDYYSNPLWQRGVRKAWECAGSMLFDAALPAWLQDRLVSGLDSSGHTILKLRLRFAGAQREFEPYPWEMLQLPPEPWSPDRPDNARLPLALRTGLLIERQVPGGVAVTAARSERRKVALVSTYDGPLAVAGERFVAQLGRLADADLVKDLTSGQATWTAFCDRVLEHRPNYLVLVAPVRRESGAEASVGFWGGREPDWRSPRDIVERVEDRELVCDGVVLVTFSASPGQDSMRGTIDVARRLAAGGIGPVAFMCHAPTYQEYFLGADDAETFPVVLVKALSSGQPLDRAVHYAQRRVVESLRRELRPTFGVPGYYGGTAADGPSRDEHVSANRSTVTQAPASWPTPPKHRAAAGGGGTG